MVSLCGSDTRTSRAISCSAPARMSIGSTASYSVSMRINAMARYKARAFG